jgi:hypothetical protein
VLHDLTWFIRYLLLMRWAHWIWTFPLLITLVVMGIETLDSSVPPSVLWRLNTPYGMFAAVLHGTTYALAIRVLVLNYNGIYGFIFRVNNPRPMWLFYPATAALLGCLAALFGLDAAIDKDVFVRIPEVLAALPVTIGAFAAFREKRQRILGPDAERVVAFVASLANERDCRKAPPPRNPRAGVVCATCALFLALCCLFYWIAVLFVLLSALPTAPPPGAQFYLPGFLLMGLILYLITRGKYYFQPHFDALIATDPRPPVLYLRSFRSDDLVRPWSLGGLSWSSTVEQRLALHFSGRGPFIAIGSPHNPAVVGAVRTLLREDEWQDRVMEWMQSSSAIVLLAGTTKWIDWELTKIVDSGYLQKLILIFPRVPRLARWKARREADVHFEALRASFEGTIWERNLEQIEKGENLRGMVFKADGGLDVIVSRPRSIMSFEWAAFLAHFWQNQDSPSPFARECRDVRAGLLQRRTAVLLDLSLLCCVLAPLELIAWYGSIGILSLLFAGTAVIALPLYYTICECLLGATAGQAITGIRLLSDDGRRPRVKTVLKRAELSLLSRAFPGIKAVATSTEMVRNKLAPRFRVLAALAWALAVGGGILSTAWLHRTVPTLLFAPGGFREIPASALLQSTGTMRAGNVEFTEGKGGPARSAVFQAGDAVDLQYVLFGFGRDASDRENLRFRGSLLSADGATISDASPFQLNDRKKFADPDVMWLEFPTDACTPPGLYQIRVQAHDVVRNADLAFHADFQVTGGARCHGSTLDLPVCPRSRFWDRGSRAVIHTELCIYTAWRGEEMPQLLGQGDHRTRAGCLYQPLI